MKLSILLFVLIIAGCGKTTDKPENSEQILESVSFGKLTVVISAENNRYLHYQWAIADLLLIDPAGNYVKFKPEKIEKNFDINFSALNERSEVLLQVDIPEGTYQGVLLMLDLSEPQIATVHEGKVNIPYLFDSDGKQIPKDNAFYQVEVGMDADTPLIIDADNPAYLSINLDIDASTRWMPMDDDNEAIDLLLTPVFHVETGISYPDNFSINGALKTFENDQLSINPIKSGFMEQSLVEIGINTELDFTINQKKSAYATAYRYISDHGQGLLRLSGDYTQPKGFNVSKVFYDHKDGGDFLLQGYITAEKKFSGSAIEVGLVSEQPGDVFISDQSLKDKTRAYNGKLVSGQKVSALASNENTFELNGMQEEDSTVVGVVVSVKGKVIEIEPLAVDHLPADLFFSGAKPLRVEYQGKKQTFIKKDNLVQFHGSMSKTNNFVATKALSLDDADKRFTISMPLISTAEVFSSLRLDRLTINPDIADKAIQTLQFKKVPVVLDLEKTPIATINIDKGAFVIVTERIEPPHKTYRYSDKEDFLVALQLQQDAGYFINAVVVDGQVDDTEINASQVIVTFYGPTGYDALEEDIDAFEQAAFNTVLKGPVSYLPILKGSPFRYFKKSKKFSAFNSTKSAMSGGSYPKVKYNDPLLSPRKLEKTLSKVEKSVSVLERKNADKARVVNKKLAVVIERQEKLNAEINRARNTVSQQRLKNRQRLLVSRARVMKGLSLTARKELIKKINVHYDALLSADNLTNKQANAKDPYTKARESQLNKQIEDRLNKLKYGDTGKPTTTAEVKQRLKNLRNDGAGSTAPSKKRGR